jgi:hypothetical protein
MPNAFKPNSSSFYSAHTPMTTAAGLHSFTFIGFFDNTTKKQFINNREEGGHNDPISIADC